MNIKFDTLKDKVVFTAAMKRLEREDRVMFQLFKDHLMYIRNTPVKECAESRLTQMTGALEYKIRSDYMDNFRMWLDLFHAVLWAEVIPMSRKAQMAELHETEY